ncbi:hypothetical protein IEK_05792 [Bacillus toyonensis]|uniref:YopX family protein n=1 Tax=Bacillus toyonensis TaxID=155322 RepID=UPI00027BF696|nr:YopX family protein [Bacillus toyonensis]EJV42126.1 hypothetical protein IEK_05792 [Bacillus toyonensis]
MREIKFRAWDEVEDKMIPFNKLWLEMEDGYGGVREFDSSTGKYEECTSEFVLMQYTGIKDKNGKEIYEGDVLDLSLDENSVIRCEIVYESPSFCRKWHNKNTIRLRQREIEPMAWNTHILYEIIGNIYENPELLKRGE